MSDFVRSAAGKFVPVAEPVSAGEDGLYFCFRHKKSATRVTCGRCEKPICDRCMIIGPAGIRCLECARNRVPVRVTGVMHDLFASLRGAGRSLSMSPLWYLIIGGIIVRAIFYLGCFHR